MKGYNPFKCKKDIETSSTEAPVFLEIGSLEQYCDCENGQCNEEQEK